MLTVLGQFRRSKGKSQRNVLYCARYVGTSLDQLSDNAEEVKIPMPWGHIAGKWWGNKLFTPVLAIHGWQDNANSFDNLIPLLKVPSVLAIDLPGHGYSTHLPEGKAYDFLEHVIMLHRIKKHFNWPKMSLLTHSFGGALGYAYASVFSDEVKWHINFECARTLMTLLRVNLPSTMSHGIDSLLKIQKQKKETPPPTYKLSKLIEMTIEGSLGSIASPETAMVLLKRGIYLADKPPDVKKNEKIIENTDLEGLIAHEKEAAVFLSNIEKDELDKIFLTLMESVRKGKEKLKTFDLGKWWGSQNQRPILCLHGWQDNANTFNTLIPHLPPDFSYFAIDLPGHGLSSHFPKGFFYKSYEVVITIRKLQNFFNWPKVSLLGHSYGAACSFVFSSLFSNTVDLFIAIDTIKPLSKDSAKEIKNGSKTIEQMLLDDSRSSSSAPLYSRDALLHRWIKGSNNSLTESSCQILMERGTEMNNGSLKLTRDCRLKKTFSSGFSQKENLLLAESITCNVLFLKSSDAPYFEKKENVFDVLKIIKKKAKRFEEQILPGSHHVHLNNPEIVAPIVGSFLKAVEE